MDCSCRTFLEEHLARPWCFQSGALMWVPETPPEHLPLDCHTRAGFSLENEPAEKVTQQLGTFAFTRTLPLPHTHWSKGR